jgi:hypothetical protein
LTEEIRRIAVQGQPGQIVLETLSRKHLSQKRAGGVTRGVGPEFKLQYQKKKTPQKTKLLMPVIPPMQEIEVGECWFQAVQAKA